MYAFVLQAIELWFSGKHSTNITTTVYHSVFAHNGKQECGTVIYLPDRTHKLTRRSNLRNNNCRMPTTISQTPADPTISEPEIVSKIDSVLIGSVRALQNEPSVWAQLSGKRVCISNTRTTQYVRGLC